MSEALDAYLAGLDPALVPAARARIHAEQARLAWEEPGLGAEEALRRALACLDLPEHRAQAAPAPPPPPEPELRLPWPSFLGILREPRAYAGLVYLLFCPFLGLAYATWILTGLGLALGLLVLLVGFPLLLGLLLSVRALGRLEARLVTVLLGVPVPCRAPLLPQGRGWWQRLGRLFREPSTWKSLLYLLIQAIPGSLCAALLTGALTLAFTLLALPFLSHLGTGLVSLDGYTFDPALWQRLLAGTLGALGLVGCFHLAWALGRLYGRFARALLGEFSPRS